MTVVMDLTLTHLTANMNLDGEFMDKTSWRSRTTSRRKRFDARTTVRLPSWVVITGNHRIKASPVHLYASFSLNIPNLNEQFKHLDICG